MKVSSVLILVGLLSSAAFSQEQKFDNSKLLPLVGEWQGTAAFHDGPQKASSIKGAKMLNDRWIKLDLKLELPEAGPVEATALLNSDTDGNIEAHFFASFDNGGLVGKGKIDGKKLTIEARPMNGEDGIVFVFDMSNPDELKLTCTETTGEHPQVLSGTYKRKK